MSFWVAGAVVASSVIGAGAAGNAADSQAQSSAAATAMTQRQFDQTRADQSQYRNVGGSALDQYGQLLGTGSGIDHSEANFNAQKYLAENPDAAEYMQTSGRSAYDHYIADGSRRTGNFWNTPDGTYGPGTAGYGSYAQPLTQAEVQMDPGYEWGRQQGQQAIDRMNAASGGRLSGAALKAASQYNTDYANSGYSTAYNRINQARSDRLNRLAALANIGQTSVQQTGAAGASAANAIGNIATAQGNAAGAAQIAQGNIWSGAGNQLASLYGRSSSPTSSYGYVPSNADTTIPMQPGGGY